MHFSLSTFARRVLALAVVALLGLVCASANAQDDPPAQAGRLSFVAGAVSIQPAGSDDWSQAAVNLPLGPGDRIYTDNNGRAEIQVGQSYLRIGPNSDVTFVDSNPGGLSFGVAQGSVHFRCMGLWPGQKDTIQTPYGADTFPRPGDARIDVLPDQNATVFSDFDSNQHITGAGFDKWVPGRTAVELVGTNPTYPQWLEFASPDWLDAWSHQRDEQIAQSDSYRYVSAEIPGAEELDSAGIWRQNPDYGAIWFPNVAPGWAPYHNGHWANHAPWGWVWVENESWGYAPFHYGRWVVLDGHWGWVPGPMDSHPVWSPALVAFSGGGGGGISAWFPLGPGEPFRPWYHTSPEYIDRINISNMRESRMVHVQNTYVNMNVVNVTYVNRVVGVSAMRHEDFAAGREAQESTVNIDRRAFDHVQVIDHPVPQPVRQTVTAPPSRPVPVVTARPLLINEAGKQVIARPGAVAVVPPVKPVPVAKPLPGRAVVAPPAATQPPPPVTNPVARPTAPLQTARPATPTQPAVTQPAGQPIPARQPPPTQPAAHPTPQPGAPVLKPAAQPTPTAQPQTKPPATTAPSTPPTDKKGDKKEKKPNP